MDSTISLIFNFHSVNNSGLDKLASEIVGGFENGKSDLSSIAAGCYWWSLH